MIDGYKRKGGNLLGCISSLISRLIITVLSVFILSIQIALSEEKSYHTIVFNGESDTVDLSYSWARTLTFREIYNWSKSRGFGLINDKPPVVDGKAFFVSKFGSVVNIADLKKDRIYHMWIDFVTFHGAQTSGIQSRLEIYVDKELITVLNFGDITEENNPYRIDIPYEYSIDGKVTIRFQEYSPSGGFWGIWDIVVSESVEMPKVITQEDVEKSEGRMQPKEKILESDKKPRKRKTAADKEIPSGKVKLPEKEKQRDTQDVKKKEQLEKPPPHGKVKDVDKKEPVGKKEPKKEQLEKLPPQEKVKDVDKKEPIEKKEQKREEKKEEKKEKKDKQIEAPETIRDDRKDKSEKKPVEIKEEPEKEQKKEEKEKEDIRMERKDGEKDTGDDRNADSENKESKKAEN